MVVSNVKSLMIELRFRFRFISLHFRPFQPDNIHGLGQVNIYNFTTIEVTVPVQCAAGEVAHAHTRARESEGTCFAADRLNGELRCNLKWIVRSSSNLDEID